MNDFSSSQDRDATRPALLGPAIGGRRRSSPTPSDAPAGPPAPFVSSRHGRASDQVPGHGGAMGATPPSPPAPAEVGEGGMADLEPSGPDPSLASPPQPAPGLTPEPELAEPDVQPPRPPATRPVEDWFDRFDLSPYQGGEDVALDEPAPATDRAPLIPELSQAETLESAAAPPAVQRSTEALERPAPGAGGRALVLGRLADRLEEIARTLRRGSVPDPSGDPLEAWLAGYALGFLDATRADEAES